MPVVPAAFMSYVRFNDEHDDGQLSTFRKRLSAEVRAQTGQEFPIFQDRNDIAWGQNWQQRIEETLDAVTLLLVVITPGLFRSPNCQDEVRRFEERERMLGRQDLILPVYYIGAREMDDPAERGNHWMAQLLASRQYADWREFRFEAFTSPTVRRAIAQLAARMGEVFWHSSGAAPVRAAQVTTPTGTSEGAQPAGTARVTAKAEPPTHVVDAYQRGDFATVGEAIKAAKPGDRILVRPGLYEEGLVVDKPLEILGVGPVQEIEIRSRDADVVVFKATIGRIANLTLRQASTENNWFGVDIVQGRLDLEGCDISSESLACVSIRGGADPRLRNNRIHDGKAGGIFVYDNGLGTLEDNDITTCTAGALSIKTGGNPTARRNRINNNHQSGVLVYDKGLGTLEDNEISSNASVGVEIRTGGNPTLRRNEIHRNHYMAVWIHKGGLGKLEENYLGGNPGGPLRISKDCENKVILDRNQE